MRIPTVETQLKQFVASDRTRRALTRRPRDAGARSVTRGAARRRPDWASRALRTSGADSQNKCECKIHCSRACLYRGIGNAARRNLRNRCNAQNLRARARPVFSAEGARAARSAGLMPSAHTHTLARYRALYDAAPDASLAAHCSRIIFQCLSRHLLALKFPGPTFNECVV